MIERIAVLGGSSVYMPEFISSIVSHNINVKEIVLLGRKTKKLSLVAGICQRILNRTGFPAKIVPTTNVQDAVKDAKYIINHVRVGGMKARARDEKIPPKMGMVGDETLGAGGFANAMRTLPVVLRFAETIEAVNPKTTFINLTNPTGIIIDAVGKWTKLNAIGVCDLPSKYIRKIAEVLKVSVSDLTVDYIGLNHMGWIQDVKIEGRSCMSKLLERLELREEEGYDFELIDLFRMVPTKTVSLYFHQDRVLKEQQRCSRFRAEVLYEAEQRILKLYADQHLSEVPELTRARNAIWYEDTIVPVIRALESKSDTNVVLCIRNEGAVRDLPADSSVEVPVSISSDGIKRREVGNCPRFLKGLFMAMKESDRLTVEAVRHRSYEYALQALTINPMVPSYGVAKKFLDRIAKDDNLELH